MKLDRKYKPLAIHLIFASVITTYYMSTEYKKREQNIFVYSAYVVSIAFVFNELFDLFVAHKINKRILSIVSGLVSLTAIILLSIFLPEDGKMFTIRNVTPLKIAGDVLFVVSVAIFLDSILIK